MARVARREVAVAAAAAARLGPRRTAAHVEAATGAASPSSLSRRPVVLSVLRRRSPSRWDGGWEAGKGCRVEGAGDVGVVEEGRVKEKVAKGRWEEGEQRRKEARWRRQEVLERRERPARLTDSRSRLDRRTGGRATKPTPGTTRRWLRERSWPASTGRRGHAHRRSTTGT